MTGYWRVKKNRNKKKSVEIDATVVKTKVEQLKVREYHICQQNTNKFQLLLVLLSAKMQFLSDHVPPV